MAVQAVWQDRYYHNKQFIQLKGCRISSNWGLYHYYCEESCESDNDLGLFYWASTEIILIFGITVVLKFISKGWEAI